MLTKYEIEEEKKEENKKMEGCTIKINPISRTYGMTFDATIWEEYTRRGWEATLPF